MKRQEKGVNIYCVLLLLTALFVLTLLLDANRGGKSTAETPYTVETETKTDAVLAPKRKRVNINTASKEELESLSGIGPALAEEILAYREAHGAFETEEDILAVKGIGQAKLDGFRAEITLSDEEGSK